MSARMTDFTLVPVEMAKFPYFGKVMTAVLLFEVVDDNNLGELSIVCRDFLRFFDEDDFDVDEYPAVDERMVMELLGAKNEAMSDFGAGGIFGGFFNYYFRFQRK